MTSTRSVTGCSPRHKPPLRALANANSSAIGSDVSLKNVAPDEQQQSLIAAGLDEGMAGFLFALDADTHDGLLGVTNHELSNLIAHPVTPLVHGLRAAVGVAT